MIAIIAMFMDHFATTFYPNYEKYWWLLLIHLIGRVAAPIMWFMVETDAPAPAECAGGRL